MQMMVDEDHKLNTLVTISQKNSNAKPELL